jgi:TonB family protein
VDPRFTVEARRKRVSGICTISFVVDETGAPRDLHVVKSIAEGLPQKLQAAALSLDENALKAVSQYRFQPAILKNRPVPVEMKIEVNFRFY